MKTFLKLSPEISCNDLCKQIQDLISKFAKENKDLPEAILVMEVKPILEPKDLPKLTYEPI